MWYYSVMMASNKKEYMKMLTRLCDTIQKQHGKCIYMQSQAKLSGENDPFYMVQAPLRDGN